MNEENQTEQTQNPNFASNASSEPQNTQGLNSSDNRKIMGILSYIGPLVIISYILASQDPFVKFHIKQGLVLLVIWVASWIVSMVIWILIPLTGLINIALLILAIVGIINVVNDREKELPIIGGLAKHFNI